LIDPDELESLHRRILESDTTAQSELAELIFNELVGIVRNKFPRQEHYEIVVDGCTDAFLNYVERPSQYNPEKGLSLVSYLVMSAKGDVLNYFQRLKRQHSRELQAENVELIPFTRNNNVSVMLDTVLIESEVDTVIKELCLSLQERECLNLMIAGIRNATEFSKVLGIEHLDSGAVRREVKRMKDRIKKRIERHRSQTRE